MLATRNAPFTLCLGPFPKAPYYTLGSKSIIFHHSGCLQVLLFTFNIHISFLEVLGENLKFCLNYKD